MTFESFWQAYPRRIGKGAARKAYEKALTLATHKEIMQGVEAFVKAEPWRGDLQYCPHPSTWLNQERWADEHDAPIVSTAQDQSAKLHEARVRGYQKNGYWHPGWGERPITDNIYQLKEKQNG